MRKIYYQENDLIGDPIANRIVNQGVIDQRTSINDRSDRCQGTMVRSPASIMVIGFENNDPISYCHCLVPTYPTI